MTGYICAHGYLFSKCPNCVEFEENKEVKSRDTEDVFMEIMQNNFPDFDEIVERTKRRG